ncbi:unnamed protein product [Nesidiocoris tenuis]|uniref:C3H1-type domain-containing protein n=1 Tax=Nesidiocoris tenuis TaxID=355587 RepID=A0A6H5H1S9_9HEMI|nr:unnamed protein product [Nesidiocoris tenuis]CAB0009330.1 unnamed protein product [Nesidiocoris tenuis]
MAMVNMNNLLNGKDSRWLQLEVCREFQRNKCSRPDTECKFAHPPANVEVQSGRVTACYDSIKHAFRIMKLSHESMIIKLFKSQVMVVFTKAFNFDTHMHDHLLVGKCCKFRGIPSQKFSFYRALFEIVRD